MAFDFDADSTVNTAFLPYMPESLSPKFISFMFHGLFLVLMIFANVLMNHFFVLSMQVNGAAKATVYNFVVCYFASLFFGALFFNEIINA